MSPSDIMHAL